MYRNLQKNLSTLIGKKMSTELENKTISINNEEYKINIPEDFYITDTNILKGATEISSLLWIDSEIYFPDIGNYALTIKGIDTRGSLFGITLPREEILSANSGQIFKNLISKGISAKAKNQKDISEYLCDQQASNQIIGLSKLGWNNSLYGEHIFVLPNKIYSNPDDETVYNYIPEKETQSQLSVYPSGSLDDWKTNIASTCKGNPLVAFAIGASFSSALYYLLNLDGGGFHFYGHSSRGKTTLLQLSASVWGNSIDPAVGGRDCYIGRWSITPNAIETIGTAYSDICLINDELGTNTDKSFSETIYNLTAGVGKVRLTEDNKQTWRTSLLSSGELKISDQIAKASGKEALAGQKVRVIDIHVEDIFTDTNGEPPKLFVENIKKNCREYFGTAGEVFIEHLLPIVNDPEKLRALRNRFSELSTSLTSDTMQPEQCRALNRFACVSLALEICVDIELIPITKPEALGSVEGALATWIEDSRSISDIEIGISNIIDYIRSNPRRFLNCAEDESTASNIMGYIKNDRYIITKKHLQEISEYTNVKEIAKKLNSLGLLHLNNSSTNGNKRLTSTHRIKGAGTVSGYAISKEILNYLGQNSEAEEIENSEGNTTPEQ